MTLKTAIDSGPAMISREVLDELTRRDPFIAERPGCATKSQPSEDKPMTTQTARKVESPTLSTEVLDELLRRVQDIDNSYRAIAQKMGQLYMCADENRVPQLTRALDKPMRNASENEQMFAAILEELKMKMNRSH